MHVFVLCQVKIGPVDFIFGEKNYHSIRPGASKVMTSFAVTYVGRISREYTVTLRHNLGTHLIQQRWTRMRSCITAQTHCHSERNTHMKRICKIHGWRTSFSCSRPSHNHRGRCFEHHSSLSSRIHRRVSSSAHELFSRSSDVRIHRQSYRAASA